MSIREDYDAWALTYDQDDNITRDLDSRVTQQQFGSHSFDAVIDCGCGTGKNIPFFAERSSRVLGLDFSAGMMEIARQKLNVSEREISRMRYHPALASDKTSRKT